MSVKLTEEQQWIEAIGRGSEKHFKMLFDRYWSRLYIVAKNALSDSEDAQDVVQEIFINLWDRKESLRIDSPRAYLYGCVRYGIARKLKKKITKREEELFESIATEADMESEIEAKDLASYIAGAIDQLPDRRREIFKKSRYEQLSNKEISEELNISLSTVENQVNKALKSLNQLKERLEGKSQ